MHEKITEAFPALASAGGYEILRIADDKSKNLMEIPMSGSGYSVSYLKGTLGQAKAYIRPIQKDLLLEVSNAIKVRTSKVSTFHKAHTVIKRMLREVPYISLFFFFLPFKEESPLVNCVSCNLIIPMAQVQKHELECDGGSSHLPSDETERYVLYTFKHVQLK